MLKIRVTAVCNRSKVNKPTSLVFSVVSCGSGPNEPTMCIRKSQNAPYVARTHIGTTRWPGEFWALQSPLGHTPVSSIALVEGDLMRIC